MSNVEVIRYTTDAEWHANRAKDCTSTESAALFGQSPYITKFELWHRKHSGVVPDFNGNERTAWGNHLEAAIAQGLAAQYGWTIEPLKSYWRRTDIRMGSSFDFIITNLPDGPAHLEIKNVDYLAFRDNWLEHDDGFIEAPAHIEIQVQHQMAVSGFKRSFIGALIGGNRAVVLERQRDDAVISGLERTIADFWKSVDAGQEPPPMMPEDAEAVIRLNRYAEPGKLLDASGDAVIETLVAKYKAACNDRDDFDEQAKVLKAEIMVAIGDAEKVITTDWTISAGIIADTPPTVIDESMIGQTYGGRKVYRNLRLSKSKKAKAAA